MRLDRLLEIVIILLNRRQISARELADRFEVSVRTIYRDIDAINLAGVPVISTRGNGGGFTIMEEFRIDRQVLSLDDIASISAALRGVHGVLSDTTSRNALEKIHALVPPQQNSAVHERSEMLVIQPNPYGISDTLKETARQLHRAILDCRVVSFDYRDIKGKSTNRRIEPHTLILLGGTWYLYGWCLLREDWRVFRLSRISSLQLKTNPFQRRPADWQATLQPQSKTEPEEIRLRFNPTLRTRAEDIFSAEAVKELEDGTLEAVVRWPVDDWVIGFLLGLGPDAEVISPCSLREAVRMRAEATASHYS